MTKWRTIGFLAFRSWRAKRKVWFKIMLLLSIACILLLYIGSITRSLNDFLDNYLLEPPAMRHIQVTALKSDQDALRNIVENSAKENNHIIEYFIRPSGVTCEVQDLEQYRDMGFDRNADAFGYILMDTDRYFDSRYLLDGRWISPGERNVGLVPENFTMNRSGDMQDWNTRLTYANGSQLIGKTVAVKYYTYKDLGDHLERDKEFSYSFKVIGTYDSLRSGSASCLVILPYEDVLNITETFDRNMEGISENQAITYSVMVDHIKNVPEVRELLQPAYSLQMGNVMLEGQPGTLQRLNVLIRILGTALTFSLFIVQFFVISSSFRHLILGRTKEISVYKAIGYPNIRIAQILFAEILSAVFITFILTIIICLCLIGLTQFILFHYATLLLTKMSLSLSFSDLLLCLILCFITAALGGLSGLRQAVHMEPSASLK